MSKWQLFVRVDDFEVETMHVSRLAWPDEVSGLVRVFEQLASSEGWRPDGQLHAYPNNSVYFAASDNCVIVGGLQLVVANGSDPLPSQYVWSEIDLSSRTDVAHALILALKKEYRGAYGLFEALTVEMWRYCVAAGITELWHEATPSTLRLYRRIGWPLEIVGDLRMHWGEECYLCRMRTAEVAGNMAAKAIRSQSHKELLAMMIRSTDAPEVAASARI